MTVTTPAFDPRSCHHIVKGKIEARLDWRLNSLPVAEWRDQLRAELIRRIGLPVASAKPGDSRRVWSRATPDGRIERWHIAVEEGADMPVYLAVPEGVKGPIPFIICLQGHSTGMHVSLAFDREDEQTPIEVAGDRDIARQCLRHGIGALCVEQRAFGLRRDRWTESHNGYGGCNDAAMHALALGRTLLGERVFDVACALRFLRRRPEADPRRIGIMGNSAGGTVSLYSFALLDGLAFAVPSSCFCRYSESWVRASFCPCGYVPGLLTVCDLPDVLGLAAPKPVAVVVGRDDAGFPTPAVEDAFSHLQSIYAACGAGASCQLLLGDGGHRFYADLAWPAITRMLEQIGMP